MKLLKTDLNTNINDLKNNVSNFNNDLKLLKEYVKQLNDNYQSTEASKYNEKLNIYLMELEKLSQNLDNSINYLNGVMSIYDEFDSSFSSKKPVN